MLGTLLLAFSLTLSVAGTVATKPVVAIRGVWQSSGSYATRV